MFFDPNSLAVRAGSLEPGGASPRRDRNINNLARAVDSSRLSAVSDAGLELLVKSSLTFSTLARRQTPTALSRSFELFVASASAGVVSTVRVLGSCCGECAGANYKQQH